MYWCDWGNIGTDGTLGKVGVDGGGKVVLNASLTTPEAITVSGPYLLWLSNGTVQDVSTGAAFPSTGILYRQAK